MSTEPDKTSPQRVTDISPKRVSVKPGMESNGQNTQVRISAIRSALLQHLAAIAAICWLAWIHQSVEWYYWVGSVLAIVGIVQLPAVTGKGPPGTLGAFALMAPALKTALHKAHLFGVLLLSACVPVSVTPPVCESPQHAWGDGDRVYHLPHDALSPVVRNSSSYAADLSSWNALRTPLTLRDSGEGFTIEVVDGGNERSGWLGLASISFDRDGHLREGIVQMNRTLLSRYPDSVAAHVMCQELGHILGLDHQHAGDSCMDDCSGRGGGPAWLSCLTTDAGQTPNDHDAEELRAIYAHAGGEGPPEPEPPVARCQGSITIDVFPGGGDHGELDSQSPVGSADSAFPAAATGADAGADTSSTSAPAVVAEPVAPREAAATEGVEPAP